MRDECQVVPWGTDTLLPATRSTKLHTLPTVIITGYAQRYICVRVCVYVRDCVWDSVISSGACTPEWVHLFKSIFVFLLFYFFVRSVFCPEDWCPAKAKETKTIARRWALKSDALPKQGYFHFTSWAPLSKWRAFTHLLIYCQINRFFPFFFFYKHGFAIEPCRAHRQHLPVGRVAFPTTPPTYGRGQCDQWHNCEQTRKSQRLRVKSLSEMVQQMMCPSHISLTHTFVPPFLCSWHRLAVKLLFLFSFQQ